MLVHVMALLQIRNLPDDVHAALRRRAAMQGTTMSELAARMLREDLALPSMAEWLAARDSEPRVDHDVDVVGALDAERGRWPEA